jgi:hypothetical protein
MRHLFQKNADVQISQIIFPLLQGKLFLKNAPLPASHGLWGVIGFKTTNFLNFQICEICISATFQ